MKKKEKFNGSDAFNIFVYGVKNLFKNLEIIGIIPDYILNLIILNLKKNLIFIFFTIKIININLITFL